MSYSINFWLQLSQNFKLCYSINKIYLRCKLKLCYRRNKIYLRCKLNGYKLDIKNVSH